ncbi:uncharacterized protein F5Z01DRAFT_676367 [Emericellopsis atlantica]|uniref:Uncharacterized protein n=1 Tax=Emericellopsis atlantica TaxID=2614577 RepID=A0A9P7ZHE7_9HYPO|nr:uncharacterized protein F5Z01DRAFT_676367 [Emericellopsis atlantica]KAG9252129.1 hypothetical protein F5Z01DRAFT_676367 [Emericellopsis atlantica]
MADQQAGGQGQEPFDRNTLAAEIIHPWLQSIVPDNLPSDDAEFHHHERVLPSSPSAARLLEARQRRRSQPVERLAQRMKRQSLIQQSPRNVGTSSDLAHDAPALAEHLCATKHKRPEADSETTSAQGHNPAALHTNEPIAADKSEMDVEETIRRGLAVPGMLRKSTDEDNGDELFTFLPFRRSADAAARCPTVVRNRPRMRRRKRRKVEGCLSKDAAPG